MSDAPWIAGAAAAAVFFAIVEGAAFKWPSRFNTLSRAIYLLGQRWPLSIFIMGAFAGGLAVHLFWHWCPAQGLGIG